MKKIIILSAIACISSFLQAQCPANRGYYADDQYQAQPYAQDRDYRDDRMMRRDDRMMNRMDRRDDRMDTRFDRRDDRMMRRDDRSVNRDESFFDSRGDLKNPEDRFTTEDDKRIYNEIRRELGSEYNNVSVAVNNGNVVLRGFVVAQDDLTDIQDQLKDVKGIRNINNQVTVRDDSNTMNRDNDNFWNRDNRTDRSDSNLWNRDDDNRSSSSRY